jgi:hypothetical protein
MPDGLEISFAVDSTRVAALVEALDVGSRPDEGTCELTRLRMGVEKGLAALDLQKHHLDEAYDKIVASELRASSIVQLAERSLAQQRADGEWLHPAIEKLRQALAQTDTAQDPERRRAIEEVLDAASAWAAAYRDLHDRLLKLAAERRTATGEVLRARPVEGEIDHAALSREFITRFPKIRAALAK